MPLWLTTEVYIDGHVEITGIETPFLYIIDVVIIYPSFMLQGEQAPVYKD